MAINTLPTAADLQPIQQAASAAKTAAEAAPGQAVSAMNTARTTDTQANPPRLRASFNKAAPLVLTNAWQTVAFQKTGTYDTDTFPNGGRFDVATNRLVAAAGETGDKQYDVEFFYKLTTALLPIHDVQIRFLIPAPTPIAFPFPDGDGFANIGSLLVSPFNALYKQVLYFNALVRQYGIQVQLRTAALISLPANRPVLVDGALSLFLR